MRAWATALLVVAVGAPASARAGSDEKVVSARNSAGTVTGTVKVTKGRSWSGGGKKFTQFQIVVSNTGAQAGSFFGKISLDGGAGGSCTYAIDVQPGDTARQEKDCKESAPWTSFDVEAKAAAL